MNFIGRKDELLRIKKLINENKQNNILIYGRRRIGKSFLIKKSLENYNGIVIHYQCKDISSQNTIAELKAIVKNKLDIKYNIEFNTIDEILEFLFTYDKEIVLVLDEYPYLINKIEGMNSILQNVIDMNKYDSKLKLIISGSQVDIMKNMLEYKDPLFGRFQDIIELKEHNYLESAEYYPNYTNEDKVLLYSVFGGDPLYNSMINTSQTAEENIINLFVKNNSFVELNIQNMLNIEISRMKYCNDIIQTIALGTKKNDDIVSKTHAEKSASLNPALNKIINMGIIKKITPINDEHNKKKTLYFINNNSLKFYYKYLFRFSSERNIMNEYDFYNTYIKEDLFSQYVPNVFEDIAKQYLILKNKKKLINPPFSKIGTYWYDDKVNKINGQFDIVTYDSNGYIFYEVKYTNNNIDYKIVNEEISQLQNLDIKYYNLGFISKNGFTNVEDKYIKITLNDIYNEKSTSEN